MKLRTFTAGVGGTGDGADLPAWLPGIGNGRGEHEATLVEIKQLDYSLPVTLSKFNQASTRHAKDPCIARTFDPALTPLPAIGFF